MNVKLGNGNRKPLSRREEIFYGILLALLSVSLFWVMPAAAQDATTNLPTALPPAVVQTSPERFVVLYPCEGTAAEVAFLRAVDLTSIQDKVTAHTEFCDTTTHTMKLLVSCGDTVVNATVTDTANANASRVLIPLDCGTVSDQNADTNLTPSCGPNDAPGLSAEYSLSFSKLTDTGVLVAKTCQSDNVVPPTFLSIDTPTLINTMLSWCSTPDGGDCEPTHLVPNLNTNTVAYTNDSACSESLRIPIPLVMQGPEGQIVIISSSFSGNVNYVNDGQFLYLQMCSGTFTFSIATW